MNKCHERPEKCADDVSRRLSSNIDLVTSDAIYHGQFESIFLRKKVYLRQRGRKVNTRLFTPRITQWNQIWKIMQMIWWTNKTAYSEWNSCKNVFICRKRSKCLLFKMDEKIVRTTLPKFNFFEPCRSKNQAFRR